MIIKNDFQVKLREERKRIGWSMKQLSDKTGVPHKTIQNWEYGAYEPAGYIKKLVLFYLSKWGE